MTAPDRATRVWAVVPVIDEIGMIDACLAALRDEADRLVVVDGGSRDGTPARAALLGARVVTAPRGRASQMNAGAAVARGDDRAGIGGGDEAGDPRRVLVFVHADTRPVRGWRRAIDAALARGARWGRFDVALDGPGSLLRTVGATMNARSRHTGICTGDQAIFVEATLFDEVGGFPMQPLMEDVEISRRLRRLAGPPAALRHTVSVSARRWREHGVLRTILWMAMLRALYFVGASPRWLHRLYYRVPS